MPGRVITVDRREKPGMGERLYLPMIVRALRVTARHFFRNLSGFITGRRRRDFVLQYHRGHEIERVILWKRYDLVGIFVLGADGAVRQDLSTP